jgi:hypothetical protein
MEEDGGTVIWRYRRSAPPGVKTRDYPYRLNILQVSQALHGADPFPVEFETSDDPQWAHFAALLACVREKAH